MVNRTIDDYKDIINMPRHISKKRTQMSVADRAAQFAPFSAVVGHDTAIKETARYTEKRKELDEMEKTIIDEKLREIESMMPQRKEIEMIYFRKDPAKKGGEYLNKRGYVKKIDVYNQDVIFTDGQKISIGDIYCIE